MTNLYWPFSQHERFQLCQCKIFDEQIVESHIEIDRSEAEKYECIHELCVFFLLFFNLIIVDISSHGCIGAMHYEVMR